MADWFDKRREAQARAYDRSQGRLFLLRFALLFVLAAAFWMSGLSRALAAGLRGWFSFPFAWPLVSITFTALAVFGYEVILFPLSVLADFSMERAHGRHHEDFGVWLRGFLVTMVLEIGLVTGAFTGFYLLMRLFPAYWWLAVTGIYAVFVAGVGEWGPARLLPRVRPPVPSGDAALEEELRRLGRKAGLDIQDAAWWHFEHQEDLEPVRLTGAGRRRRVVFTERAWQQMGHREKVFLAARQMALVQAGPAIGLQAFQVALAGSALFGTAKLTEWAARRKAFPAPSRRKLFRFWWHVCLRWPPWRESRPMRPFAAPNCAPTASPCAMRAARRCCNPVCGRNSISNPSPWMPRSGRFCCCAGCPPPPSGWPVRPPAHKPRRPETDVPRRIFPGCQPVSCRPEVPGQPGHSRFSVIAPARCGAVPEMPGLHRAGGCGDESAFTCLQTRPATRWSQTESCPEHGDSCPTLFQMN